MSAVRAPFYFALIHYPIRNRLGEDVATAITNLDIHDGSRLAATFGTQRYYLVSPIDEQRSLVHRLRDHWITGPGAQRNPLRRLGMEKVEHAFDLEEICERITQKHKVRPLLVGTSARATDSQKISYQELREHLTGHDQPVLLLFGTGWGISPTITPPIDKFLPPIWGPTDYNHLSVRAAMAITLDRLLGQDRDPAASH